MELVVVTLASALIGAIVSVGLATAYRLWRQLRAGGSPPMDRILDRHGVRAQARHDADALVRAGAAARTCLLCRDQAVCLAWLEGERSVSLRQFCPNAEMIERLTR